jgi:hypothetical protein
MRDRSHACRALTVSTMLMPLLACDHPSPSSPQAPSTPLAPSQFVLSGRIHEPPPTASTLLAGVQVDVSSGPLDGRAFLTDANGRFALPAVTAGGFSLTAHKAGYEDATFAVDGLTADLNVDVELRPEPGIVSFATSGTNSCAELPTMKVGCASTGACWQGPVITSFPVYHSGPLIVTDSLIPAWGSPELDVIQLAPDGSVVRVGPHLARLGTQLEAGYRYMLGFGGNVLFCSPFRVSLTRPK